MPGTQEPRHPVGYVQRCGQPVADPNGKVTQSGRLGEDVPHHLTRSPHQPHWAGGKAVGREQCIALGPTTLTHSVYHGIRSRDSKLVVSHCDSRHRWVSHAGTFHEGAVIDEGPTGGTIGQKALRPYPEIPEPQANWDGPRDNRIEYPHSGPGCRGEAHPWSPPHPFVVPLVGPRWGPHSPALTLSRHPPAGTTGEQSSEPARGVFPL